MDTSVESAVFGEATERSGRRTLLLVGARVAVNGLEAQRADIEIRNGRIQSFHPADETAALANSGQPNEIIDLSGYLILPGLINAHDHLEFNLFPRLGNGPYSNYKQWAADIYHPDLSPLREHLNVPERVRLWWGGLKNLLAGVTTVCHHNPYVPEVFDATFPVRVLKRFTWSHSLAFANDIRKDFASLEPDMPFLIHLGEGTDAESAQEIFELQNLGALDGRTVIVHGVGLDAVGYDLLRSSQAALVWCPTSNMFTLGKTLDLPSVAGCRMALGSDSAITARGDLLDEIRSARQSGLGLLHAYSLVTDSAVDVLRLRNGEGTIRPGGRADLLAMKDTDQSPAEALVEARQHDVELVMLSGEPVLFSPALSARWLEDSGRDFEPLSVEGTSRLVRAPVKSLIAEARRHLGSRLFLAGKEIDA